MDDTMHGHGVPGLAPADAHAHPGPRTYIGIAIILAVITLIEVAIFYLPDYVEGTRPLLVPSFIGLSAVKFCLVVLFFMHLKFDPKIFAGIFAFFLLIAISIAVAFLSLFHGFYFF